MKYSASWKILDNNLTKTKLNMEKLIQNIQFKIL